MASSRIAVIMNPVAGRGAAVRAWRTIGPDLRRVGLRWTEVTAHRPLQAWALAEDAARDGAEVVVAMGGDGTLHEVLNGLLRARPHDPPALALIPAGTANIFARALGLPTDPLRAARVLLEGRRRRIDVGQVNDRYFASVAGAGFDGAVVRMASRWPRRIGGKPRHVAAGLLALATYRAPQARVWLDGREQAGRLFLLAAANTGWYGGGVHIAPHARPDDGRLSVVCCREVGRVAVFGLLARAFRGRHLDHPSVTHGDAVEIRLESDAPLLLHADGEALGAGPATFRCVPGALVVLVPRHGL